MSSIIVRLIANLPGPRLAQLIRNIERDLSAEGIQASHLEVRPEPGERMGEPTPGTLVLASITSGTIRALLNCFKTYLARERALTIQLTRADGTRVEVTARNVDTRAILEAIEPPEPFKVRPPGR